MTGGNMLGNHDDDVDDDNDNNDDNDNGNLQGEYFIKIGRRCH